MSKKLSVLLGLRDKEEKTFGNMLLDMLTKFKGKGSNLFAGFKKTYKALPKPGGGEEYADDPTKRGFQNVASTVKEQMDWLKKYSAGYMQAIFSIEKTNAQGIKAHLIVDKEDWGEYTTLELLRLKSVLDGKLRTMVNELPIRSEVAIWKKTTAPEFGARDIWETDVDKGFTKTTLKRMEILNDPHIKDAPGRAPMVQQIDTQVNTGEYTSQDFSGAITNLERATIQAKLDVLYKAVVEALETANNVDSVESNLGDKMLEYLF